jgi:dihydrofolate synthase/folylpolyglutamate synthase
MPSRDLNAWLRWIKSYHDQAINYNLDNVQLAAKQLQLENFSIPVVTVAGTNGKGSCIATMEAILLAHGYKVGAYISPHIFNFTERIRINATPISVAELCAALELVHNYVLANNKINLSYFEFATIAALIIFKAKNLDIVLLEVGLGGRLDAVNVVTNDIAIITSISLDHCAYLGNTREDIGFEKAGIIKPGAVAIYADPDMPHSIRQQAKACAATLLRLGTDYTYEEKLDRWSYRAGAHSYDDLAVPSFPLANAAAGLQALSLLPGFELRGSIIAKVFVDLKVVGRFQIESLRSRTLIFDVAHNPAAVAWLVSKLAKHPCSGKTLVIVGIAATKDSQAMFEAWDCAVAKWFVCVPKGMRRATPQSKMLAAISLTQAGELVAAENVAQALSLALMQTEVKDRIVIFGSFHTVAEALAEFYRMKEHGEF